MEGYVIQFFSDDFPGNDESFVFVSEDIEKLSGGKARRTIHRTTEHEITAHHLLYMKSLIHSFRLRNPQVTVLHIYLTDSNKMISA